MQKLGVLLQEHESEVGGLELARKAVVVEVVVKLAVPRPEFELLQELVVVHHVQRVEDVVALTLGHNQRVVHQLQQRRLGGHVVVGVGRLEHRVVLVGEDGRRQRIEAAKVGEVPGPRALHHEALNNVLPGQQPVLDVGFFQVGGHGELG